MHRPLFILFTCLLFCQHLHADPDDSPSPQILQEKATVLRDAATQLGKDFRAVSKGKNWGLSPGHKALYQSIFSYRNELQTVTEMCKPGSLPDRLLTVAMECKVKGKAMADLAVFVIIPDEILQQINALSKRSAELLPPVQQYEQRYLSWRKIDLERKHAQDLARLGKELADLKNNQNQIIQRANTTVADDYCPPPPVVVVRKPRTDHRPPPRPPGRTDPPVCPPRRGQ